MLFGRFIFILLILTSLITGQNIKVNIGPQAGLLSQAAHSKGVDQSANLGFILGARCDLLINKHGILSEITYRRNSTNFAKIPEATKTDLTNSMIVYSQSYYFHFLQKGGFKINPLVGIDILYLMNQEIGKYRVDYGYGYTGFSEKQEWEVNEFTFGVHFGIDFGIPIRDETFHIKLVYDLVDQKIVEYSGFNITLCYSFEIYSKTAFQL